MTEPAGDIHGVMAEFDSAEALVEAVRQVHEAGFTRFDAYTPMPLPDLDEAMGIRRTVLPRIVLLCAAIGGVCGYLLQYYTSNVAYPINVGGRPLHSWPSFIPITFELTILFAAAAAVIGMIALNGLPLLHHPVFNAHRFARASQDAFFLCIEADDPRFDRNQVIALLSHLGATEVTTVEL